MLFLKKITRRRITLYTVIQTLSHENVNETALHSQASLGQVSQHSGLEFRVLTCWQAGRGLNKGNAWWASQNSRLIWVQCAFYLWSPDHYLSLFNWKQAEKATAPKAGNGETGTRFAAGGPTQGRHLSRPPAGSLETHSFSRYSITHPTAPYQGTGLYVWHPLGYCNTA